MNGVIELTMKEVIDRAAREKFTLSLSYLEIYNEKVYDMLARQDRGPVEVHVREDHNHKIVVPGLTEAALTSIEGFRGIYAKADQARRTAATKLNASSSRSHAVLCVKVSGPLDASGRRLVAKLQLIDLAGSEDNRKTGNVGERMAESTNINMSLFALSQVVSMLNEVGNKGRIPYRDSKLTRLLQDSLGGSASATMIVCVAPEASFATESARTLKFALKAMNINNTPTANVDSSVEEREREERERREKEGERERERVSMAEKLAQWKARKSGGGGGAGEKGGLAAGPGRVANPAVAAAAVVAAAPAATTTAPPEAAKQGKKRKQPSSHSSSSSSSSSSAEAEKDPDFSVEEVDESETPAPKRKAKRRPAAKRSKTKEQEPQNSENSASQANPPAITFTCPALVKSSIEAQILATLNSGNLKLIMTLPGVGKKRAQAILDHRKELGVDFSDVDEALKGSGLPETMARGFFSHALGQAMIAQLAEA
jgi:kinesin family protein 22